MNDAPVGQSICIAAGLGGIVATATSKDPSERVYPMFVIRKSLKMVMVCPQPRSFYIGEIAEWGRVIHDMGARCTRNSLPFEMVSFMIVG